MRNFIKEFYFFFYKARTLFVIYNTSIFTNITTFAIGCIVDAQVRAELCERLTIPHMQYDLDTIAQNNKDLASYIEGDTLMINPYQKAFLLGLDRTVFTVARMQIPSELSKTSLFRTGINLKTKGEEVEEESDEDEDEYEEF